MHVAFFSPSWPPGNAANGIVTYVQQIRMELLRLGHKVTVVSQGKAYSSDGSTKQLPWTYSPSERLIAKLNCILGRQARRLPNAGRLLARAFKAVHCRDPIDVIEMEESFGWSHDVQARLPIPVVTRLHGPYFLTRTKIFAGGGEKLSRRRLEAEDRSIRSATALSAPSAALMELVAERYGCKARWRAIIPNPMSPAVPDERWRLENCDPHEFVLVGRFDSAKGADVALNALEIVLEQQPRAKLIIIGPDNGIELENGLLAGFEEYCATKVSSRARRQVEFQGALSRGEVDRYRRRAFAVLVCSRFENFPYVVLESMAIGTPIITSDGCIADLIIDGVTGRMVPAGSPSVLAEAMLEMMADPGRAAAMAKAGWERCRLLYSNDAIAPRIIAFYDSVRTGFSQK